MSSTQDHAQAAPPKAMPGGVGELRAVTADDLKIWNLYKDQLEKKIQDQFHVLKSYTLKPVQVATQVVSGVNYFFKVEVPEHKFATVRVHHVAWKADTHGQADHVVVHEKLADSPNESVSHF